MNNILVSLSKCCQSLCHHTRKVSLAVVKRDSGMNVRSDTIQHNEVLINDQNE